MAGRDFVKFGGQFDIANRIGDGDGLPFEGKVKVRWVGKEYLAVINNNNDVELLTGNGNVAFKLRNGIAIEEAKRLKALTGGKEDIQNEHEDEKYDHWFEDPQYLLTMEEKEEIRMKREEMERAAMAAPPPTKRIVLNIQAADICRLPRNEMKVAIACTF